MLDEVTHRLIKFKNETEVIGYFNLFTNMFAEQPSQNLKIEEGNQLVGFAVAVDENGIPGWIDFVVTTGGQWQYREGETCKQYHPLKLKLAAKFLFSEDNPVKCDLCKAPIADLKDGYYTCQDICNFHCCLKCFNDNTI